MKNSLVKTFNILELNKIADHIPCALIWKDRNNKLLGANKSALKCMGFKSAKQFIGRIDYEILSLEDLAQYQSDDISVLEHGKVINRKFRYRNLNDETSCSQITKAPLYDTTGDIIGVICIISNVEINLKETEPVNNHQMLFKQLEKNLSLIPSAFYWKDKNSIFLGVNEVALKYVGLSSAKDIIGKRDDEIWGIEFAKKYIEDDKYVLSTGKILSKEDVYTDINGNIRYCHVIKAPFYDENNNIIGVIGNSIDITAEKEAEKLKIEIEKRSAIDQQQLIFKEFFEQLIQKMTPFVQLIDSFKLSNLNNNIGATRSNSTNSNIQLTKREEEILYYLSLNKSPKEIAQILSIIDKKNISFKTVQSIIDKQLYPKFGIFSIGQLIAEARIKGLIPFILSKTILASK